MSHDNCIAYFSPHNNWSWRFLRRKFLIEFLKRAELDGHFNGALSFSRCLRKQGYHLIIMLWYGR
jgi:hypothetical protein